MKKTVIALFIVLNLHAQNYEELLELAIKNNTQLQIAQSQEEKTRLQGEINTRLENPNIEFEIADFSAKRFLRENQLGTQIGISQSLLLPSVKADKKALSQSKIALSTQSFQLEKSAFIYAFNLKYLAHREAQQKELLEKEALEISQNILTVVQKRFMAESIAKSEFLQAKIENTKALNNIKSLALKTIKEKNALLLFSNLDQTFNVDSSHVFVQKSTKAIHPLISLTEKKEALAQATFALASHNIERIELFSEIEAEPDQDIFRIGISLPLPIFNNKSQEKQLAKIEMNNQRLALASQKKALNLEIPQLQNEIAVQEKLQQNYQALSQEQQELLAMYQEGYAIAKVNLLKLNTIKKELLISKNKLLETAFSIERNNIKINYLQGAYND